jgi:DNA polymerase-3 subunit epsilon
VHDLLSKAALVVAHNAEFDLPFVRRELEGAGFAMPDCPTYCTMLAWRAATGGRAGLDAIRAGWGMPPRGNHSALEDAWMAYQVYGRLNFGLLPKAFPNPALLRPSNYVQPPPRPEGPLPRRKRRKA